MPQRQVHRGQHPQDVTLFDEARVPALRDAVRDLSYLLTRGYSDAAALKIVGDHYQLTARQRNAVTRGACAEQSLEWRRAHQVNPDRLRNSPIALDGYNILISVEAALSGGVLFLCRDGCIRDIASVHGSYRSVHETQPALAIIGKVLREFEVSAAQWYLDAPVSNSGRLRALMQGIAKEHAWPWEVDIVQNPDSLLPTLNMTIATTDGWVLDRAQAWLNLMPLVLPHVTPAPRLVALAECS